MIRGRPEPLAGTNHGTTGERNPFARKLTSPQLRSLPRGGTEIPAGSVALVVREDGQREVVASGGQIDGAAAREVLIVNIGPVSVRWRIGDAPARDGLLVSCNIEFGVSAIAERSELASFLLTLAVGRSVVSSADVEQHLARGVVDAVRDFLKLRDAADLFSSEAREALERTVCGALEGPCFTAGLGLTSAARVALECPALQDIQRVRAAAARRQEELAASRAVRETELKERAQRLDSAGVLVARLQALAESSGRVSTAALIRSFTENERAELYAAVFGRRDPARATRWVVVAAGEELLVLDAGQWDSSPRRIRLAGRIGRPRSLSIDPSSPDAVHGWVGAATGLYRVSLDAGIDGTYEVEDQPRVRGGFNAIAICGGRVIASHSELGIRWWSINDSMERGAMLRSRTEGAQAVRQLQTAGDELVCSVDDRVLRWPANEANPRDAEVLDGVDGTITALAWSPEGLLAGTHQGSLWCWWWDAPRKPELLRRGHQRPLESIRVDSRCGITRCLLADTTSAAYARMLGDQFECRYESGGQPVRWVEGADDWIVGTTELRDRLLCWRPSSPERIEAVVSVGAMCGHPIQDVKLWPANPSSVPPCGT